MAKLKSIADKEHVTDLARQLSSRIPVIANLPNTPYGWTGAVWTAFNELAQAKKWTLYPGKQPYKGEYLLDFVLWEENYGPRVVCESQWQHRISGMPAIDWAFDKLRGVKGDIKVLIFECPMKGDATRPPDNVMRIVEPYLKELSLLSDGEAFLLLHFANKGKRAHWWKPTRQGNPNKIRFTPIPLD